MDYCARMDQDLHQYVLSELDAAKGRWPEISAETGVPYQTMTKIAQRRIRNPGISHIQNLADYFKRQGGLPQRRAGEVAA